MKLPKKLRLLGYDWKVICTKDDSKDASGNFFWKKKKITINDKYGEAQAILLHEIVEAVMVKNLARYYGNEGNSEFRFIFNHTEFTKIVNDIFVALADNDLLKL